MGRAKEFLHNGLILTGASLLMRTVSVCFNAWISNRVGAEVMGLLSLVFSVNVFAVTFATSGVNLGCTRLVAEALGKNRPAEVRGAVWRCFWYSLAFGSAACVLVVLLAPFLADRVIGDARTLSSLRLLGVSLVPLSLSSALSGYFAAVRRVKKSAAAQIAEQAVRIGVCSAGLALLAPAGAEYACMAIVAGGSVAELSSFALLLVLYLIDRHRHFPDKRPACPGMTGRLLHISLPVAVSAYARSGLVSLEHLLIPLGLQKSGLSRSEALSSYGILNSMVLPVILYPAAITGAFASLLVPEMAESRAAGDTERINRVAARVLRITLAFALGCSGILCTLSREFGLVIYGSGEAGRYIRVLAVLVPVMYLDGAVDAILKGLGQQVYTMGVNIADAGLSVILVWFLLPREGIWGYVAVIYITELLNDILSLYRLVSLLQMRLNLFRQILLPLLCVVLSGVLSRFVFDLMPGFFNTPLSLCLHTVIMAGTYFLGLLFTGALAPEDRHLLRALR